MQKKNLLMLKQLCKSNKAARKKILADGGKPLQHCLRECAVNLLSGTIPLNKRQFQKLKRYKTGIRDLSRRKTSYKKRLHIEQKGGFLASLLLPIIGSLAGAIIKKTSKKREK